MAERRRRIGSSMDMMPEMGGGIDAVQGLEEVALMCIVFTPATEDGETGTIEGTEYATSTDTEGIRNSASRSQNSEGKGHLILDSGS